MTNEELVELIQSGVDMSNNLGLLYQQNKNIIYKLALPYSETVDIEDLMQEAYFGLEKAAKNFDSSTGYKFITYATSTIKGYIHRYHQKYGRTKRIPIHILNLISKFYKITNLYLNDKGEPPSDEYIMNELSLNIKQFNNLKKVLQEINTVSFDDILTGTELTVSDTLSDGVDFEEDVVQKMFEQQCSKELWECVNELDERLKNVIVERYKNNKFLSDIASDLKVSPERIRQMEKNAIKLLKQKENLQKIAKNFGYDSSAMYNSSGFGYWKNHGSSITEYIALKRIEIEEKTKKLDDALLKLKQL